MAAPFQPSSVVGLHRLGTQCATRLPSILFSCPPRDQLELGRLLLCLAACCRMPHKIGFIVVSSSGHEDGFSAKELMVHAPTVNGWRSPRLCQYPQEIVLQLAERCRIRKLQLLAHQYMISSKVEFYISESLPECFAPYQAERFQRLGYVPLSDNEKTDFEARELKSVYVDAVGQYLKLIFHKNYANKHNLYGQVALVAVNIIGEPADCSHGSSHPPSREQLVDHYLGVSAEDPALAGSYPGKCDSISPLDDLAFDMYQDPEVARLIRRLEQRKRQAVRRERYDRAQQLKQAMADLQKVGERLGRYEVEKRRAAEREDYELAQSKKQQMEAYRLQVYQQLQLHPLLHAELLDHKPELPLEPGMCPGSPQRPSAAPSPPAEHREEPWAAEPVLEERPAAPAAAQPLPPHQSPAAPEPQPSLDSKCSLPCQAELLPYDERPLPAICKQPQAHLGPERAEEAPSAPPARGITGEPEPLSEKALREASLAVEVFGEALVAGAYSRSWSRREDALLAVYSRLLQVPQGTPREELRSMLRAATLLARRASKDIVSSVFQAALKLLKMLLTQYIPRHRLGKAEAAQCVEGALPALLASTGDSSARRRLLAAAFIRELALCAEVRALQVVPAQLLQPLRPNCAPQLAASRLQLVESLLGELGTEGSGFTVTNVMKFATGAVEHRAQEVREAALRIISALYSRHRAAVVELLPPAQASTPRSLLYRSLWEGFSRMDGRGSEAELRARRKAATEEAERQKKEEIKALQGQLAALKEIQAEVQAGKEPEFDVQKPEDQGQQAGSSPQPAAEVPEEHSSAASYLDNLCIFCGERDESFTEEGLDLHYWKHCPMLIRCEHCKQVVEIAGLTEHLLADCERRESFVRCPRCSEALPREHLPRHLRSKACTSAKPETVANHCPLCHDNFAPGEEAWKSHLLGRDGCRMNRRRVAPMNKTLLLQPGRAAGRKPGAAGPKAQPPSLASKIPAPRGSPNKSTAKTYSKQ
ncbi:centrosomal protein of 104 kDa [Dryobates pubescens]|uniref:centrosomal protein of 104 kDa n=1 Tax=Dryobates pubescens TaxID=118200 RepID=UPI0023BA0D31|nr:centrosomal protein of 104 kDa [Dryobates pubescens]